MDLTGIIQGSDYPSGAEYMVKISGREGVIKKANLYKMGIEETWEEVSGLTVAKDSDELETAVPLDNLEFPLLETMNLFFYTRGWGGERDETNFITLVEDHFNVLESRAPGDTPTVNGLFYGDGDNETYSLLGSALDGRGSTYYVLDGDILYIAVVVSYDVNDNVFGQNKVDNTYTDSANWAKHDFKALYNSDHVELELTDGSTTYTWMQDYIYDADYDKDPSEADWLSDYSGNDGSGTPPPQITSASSLSYNLNYGTWDMTLGGTRNDWASYKSIDSDSDDDVNDEGWPYYNSYYNWEWSMVYEMSFNVSGMDIPNTTLEVISAHNSPPKYGDPDVPIPPETIPEMKDIIIPIFMVTVIFFVFRRKGVNTRKKGSRNQGSIQAFSGEEVQEATLDPNL